MATTRMLVLLTFALAVFTARESAPQGSTTARAGGIYDPKAVETISGEVISVERVAHGRGMGKDPLWARGGRR
jgi:hypothetical protein